MKLMERVRTVRDYFTRLEEAIDYDPVEELHQHVERLERRLALGTATAEQRENAGTQNASRR